MRGNHVLRKATIRPKNPIHGLILAVASIQRAIRIDPPSASTAVITRLPEVQSPDPITNLPVARHLWAQANYRTSWLVRACERQLSPIGTLIYLVVGVTETGSSNADEQFSRSRLRNWDVVAELVVFIELILKSSDPSPKYETLVDRKAYLDQSQRLHCLWDGVLLRHCAFLLACSGITLKVRIHNK
jgi:hypothetical protein